MSPIHDVTSLGTLLGVWAHPDDEAFLSAGLMSLARRAGNRVVCVVATAGEHGTDRPDLWPPARLAAVRAREQRAALQVLGVDELVELGYVDGTCADVDARLAAQRVADVVAAVRPDTVVTFGSDGMTGHPDHRTVSAWTSAALAMADVEPRLLHATVTPEFVARERGTNATLGAFGPGLPVTTPPARLALRLALDAETLDRKLAALRAHTSQTQPQERLVGTAAFRRWWREESFVAAPPARAVGAGLLGKAAS